MRGFSGWNNCTGWSKAGKESGIAGEETQKIIARLEADVAQYVRIRFASAVLVQAVEKNTRAPFLKGPMSFSLVSPLVHSRELGQIIFFIHHHHLVELAEANVDRTVLFKYSPGM